MLTFFSTGSELLERKQVAEPAQAPPCLPAFPPTPNSTLSLDCYVSSLCMTSYIYHLVNISIPSILLRVFKIVTRLPYCRSFAVHSTDYKAHRQPQTQRGQATAKGCSGAHRACQFPFSIRLRTPYKPAAHQPGVTINTVSLQLEIPKTLSYSLLLA